MKRTIIRGTVAIRILDEPKQRLATVVPLLFGGGRVTISERYLRREGFDDPNAELYQWDRGFDYATLDEALTALREWEDGDTAPPGSWLKMHPSKCAVPRVQ
jgi:hypothetical protein